MLLWCLKFLASAIYHFVICLKPDFTKYLAMHPNHQSVNKYFTGSISLHWAQRDLIWVHHVQRDLKLYPVSWPILRQQWQQHEASIILFLVGAERNWVGPCKSQDAMIFFLNTPSEQFTGPWNEVKLSDLHQGTQKGKSWFDGCGKILPAGVSASNTELNQPFTCDQQTCKSSLMSIYRAQVLKIYFTFYLSLY